MYQSDPRSTLVLLTAGHHDAAAWQSENFELANSVRVVRVDAGLASVDGSIVTAAYYTRAASERENFGAALEAVRRQICKTPAPQVVR